MPKATGPIYTVPFRRRREYRTNFAKRLALVKSRLPRLVVRKTNRHVLVLFVEYAKTGDHVLARANYEAIRAAGWLPKCNTPTAYLAAYQAALLAKKAGVSDFVLDIGMATPSTGSLVFAALQGAIDAGLKTAFDAEMVPADRLNGSAIAAYATALKKDNADEYKKRFSEYLKANVTPENLPAVFEQAKAKLAKA